LGSGELGDDGVGVVGEVEKICSSRSRKFASRFTITSAGEELDVTLVGWEQVDQTVGQSAFCRRSTE
jgi:hypothetical protein